MQLTATELVMASDGESMDIPFQVRCSRKWLNRVKRAAARMGMSAATYIRQATILKMELDGVPEEEPEPPRRGRKPKPD